MLKVIEEKADKKETNHPNGFKLWKTIVMFFVGWVGIDIAVYGAEILWCLFNGVSIQDTFNFMLYNTTTEKILYLYSEKYPGNIYIQSNLFINFFVYIVLFITLTAIVNVDFKHIFPSFKNGKAFLAALLGLAAILVFNRIYSILVNFFYNLQDNENQGRVVQLVTLYPSYGIIVVSILAPIVEELTYRVGLFGSIRKMCKTKIVAYVVTALIFALIHFSTDSFLQLLNGDSANFINELLNLPTYIFAGLTFSYLYDKYGFAGSVMCHTYNNFLSVFEILIYDKLGLL